MQSGTCSSWLPASTGGLARAARCARVSQPPQSKRVIAAAGRTRAPVLESVDEPALYRYAHALKKPRGSSSDRLPTKHLSHESPVTPQNPQPALKDIQSSLQQSSTAANAEQESASAGIPQALLRLLPRWTPRIRGLVLLNLLVLLVATNWVCLQARCTAFWPADHCSWPPDEPNDCHFILQVVLRDTESFFDAFDFAALRFTIAAAAFSPFLSKAVKDRKIAQAGIELGAWSALGYLTQAQGLLTSDASRASFISTFTVSQLDQGH